MFSSSDYQDVSLTLANCGDNIAIYLPVFAAGSPLTIVVTLIVFYLMLMLFFVGAYMLVGNAKVTEFLEAYGQIIVPICLIGLGINILIIQFYSLFAVSRSLICQ